MNSCVEKPIHIPTGKECDDCYALEQQVRQLRAQLESIEAQLSDKQNELTAGENITIENDVISAASGADALIDDTTTSAVKVYSSLKTQGLIDGLASDISDVSDGVSYQATRITNIQQLLGTTDISSIDDGTVTGAIDALNNNAVVLYNNPSASVSNDAIILSDSVANYRRITIYYKDNDSVFNSIEVFEPNNKDVMLTIPHFNSGLDAMHIKAQVRRIVGAQLNAATRSGQFNIYASGNPTIQTTPYIAVVAVIGYKK